MKTHLLTTIVIMFALISSLHAGFVDSNHKPVIRTGTLPIRDVAFFFKNTYVKKGKYGVHSYWTKYKDKKRKREKNGMLYTCRGGFLDIAHVRNAIDWVGYLSAKLYPLMLKGETNYVHMGEEDTLYKLKFDYPDEYLQLSGDKREQVAKILSVLTAQVVAYDTLVWHEIITWSGYIHHLYSEKPSGFSFEDNFSNAIGIIIGGSAVLSPDSFNKAADYALKKLFTFLKPVSKSDGIDTIRSVAGSWWNNHYWLPLSKKIMKRNLDYGQFDGKVTPWQVKGAIGCDGTERPLPITLPYLKKIENIDFSNFIDVTVTSNLGRQDDKISYYFEDNPEIINRLKPLIHFPIMVEKIRSDLIKEMNDPNADRI